MSSAGRRSTAAGTPPPIQPARDWRFPRVDDLSLSNGIRVLAYDCPGQHVIAASVVFDVPLALEPRELEGVAGLVGRCLTQGAAGRNAEEFADALALCGSDLQAVASPDAFTVRLSAPSTQLDVAVGLMADVVRSPDFLDSEFEHEKRLRLQEIDQSSAYPQHVAGEQLNATLFGDARVARPWGGSAEAVARVGRHDVVSFARRHLHPANATIVVAGDFSGTDPVVALERELGDWAVAGDASPDVAPPEPSAAPHLVLVDFPDAVQATIRLGGTGVERADLRWPSMFVANYVVGGNFSSRINTVLRERKGVTYGASSSLDTGKGTGLLTASTSVRSDAAAESVADIVAILRDASGTLTDDEVLPAVRATSDSAAIGFERADAVVTRVELLLTQRLPLDHVDRNLARIRAVTTADANAAYREIVRPDAFSIVVVGDAASVRGPLADLGYADVVVLPSP
jgi:predicted Zn-dependent peptidase